MRCDNCSAEGKDSETTVTLGDGLRLCADCWNEVKDDCEPINE
jgi:hypothetical protein